VTIRRAFLLVTLLAGLMMACSSNEMSLTEYADRLNSISERAGRQGRSLAAAAEARGGNLTPQDISRGLESARQIRLDIRDAADDIAPPAAVAELHDRIFDWHDRFITIEATLAALARDIPDTDAGWTALSASPEMAAYRSAMADGKTICAQYQGELDSTAERGGFADVPWIPDRMKEVVDVVVGCAWFPDDPASVYRWPAEPSP
jgi:hypothetical protein